jgi:hypothetical protein
MKINNLVILIMIFLFSPFYLFSQIDCPGGSGQWNQHNIDYDFWQYGPGGNVDYQSRQGGSNIWQIKVDWSSFQNESDFVPDNAMKKILETKAVEATVPAIYGNYECDVYVYFTRQCFARVKLVLNLDKTLQVACSDQGVSLCQDVYNRTINGDQYYFYNIYKDVACGEKCCARVYHCTRVYDAISGKWETSVGTPTTTSISTCSGDSDYDDCLTGDPIPCTDGSCDGYY